MFYFSYGKRLVDLVIVVPLLVCLFPLLCLLYLLVRIRQGTPVFFLQERLGKDAVPFKIIKISTMTQERDEAGELLQDSERLTSLGRFLRNTSIDELPELWNVLRGEMSLVGPRPLLVEYGPLYTSEQARRHEVKPGITGWAQVNGRNSLSWEDRFECDNWYVENQSMWLDFKILYKTLSVAVSRQGVNAESHATMPRFTGTSQDDEQFGRAA